MKLNSKINRKLRDGEVIKEAITMVQTTTVYGAKVLTMTLVGEIIQIIEAGEQNIIKEDGKTALTVDGATEQNKDGDGDISIPIVNLNFLYHRIISGELEVSVED